MSPTRILLAALLVTGACRTQPRGEPLEASPELPATAPPFAGPASVDHLIEPGEAHFAHLWQLTEGGENAEGYWSFAGDALVFQRRAPGEHDCDQIYRLGAGAPERELLSTGQGATTCAYFLPGDERVIFASTHAAASACPPAPDHSQGYVWRIHPEHDLWIRSLATGALESFLPAPGYDAEATVSPRGDRIVFTSTRSGDLELWTCALDGSELRQVTSEPGYDGGAFFSHDGERLVFRSTAFAEEPAARAAELVTYTDLLRQSLVRPSRMEIMLCNADGSERRALTALGGANFAPFFFPDDERVLFASNHHGAGARNFDLFAIGVDRQGLERVTTYAGFDSFPMFSPDGRYLVFASNRGGRAEGETNLFVAAWR